MKQEKQLGKKMATEDKIRTQKRRQKNKENLGNLFYFCTYKYRKHIPGITKCRIYVVNLFYIFCDTATAVQI